MAYQYGSQTATILPKVRSAQDGLVGPFFTTLCLPGGATTTVNIDTGSVGFVLPATMLQDQSGAFLPWVKSTGQRMTLTYKPSTVTVSGTIVEVTGLTLTDVPEGETPIEIGTVRALAHDGSAAPYMMGVGFGLQAQSYMDDPNGQPLPGVSTNTALDNPFMNVVGMSREPGAPFQAGYSLSAYGRGKVTLGQTADTLAGFRFMPLTADPTSPSGYQLPWVDVRVTSPDGGAVQTKAQMLMDAGIENMFLAVYEPSPPAAGTSPAHLHIDWAGKAVGIQARDAAGALVVDYGFVNANPSADAHANTNTDLDQPASPSTVLPGGPSPQGGSFLNTGVHPLAIYDYAVDFVNGQLGFRLRV